MDDIILIIPTLEPNENFIEIVDRYKKSFNNIIVVNDGSPRLYDETFNKIKDKGVVMLTHALNFGKGRALKTAFNYVLNNYKSAVGVITVDSDGQHLVKDAVNCAEALKRSRNRLVLGSRDFDKDNVPNKSKYGNKLTSKVLKLLCGIDINDSQTGLRAISLENLKKFLYTKGERFEYETNMLLDAQKYNIDFLEVPIDTVYLNDNKGSHFNPLKDSFEIYKSFFKYIFVAISSFLIDIMFFTVFIKLLSNTYFLEYNVAISSILARICSSLYNFMLNKSIVFMTNTISDEDKGLYKNSDYINDNALPKKVNSSSKLTDSSRAFIFRYYCLVIIQMFISTIVMFILSSIFGVKFILIQKIIVDLAIFMANYYIQREWVFKQERS